MTPTLPPPATGTKSDQPAAGKRVLPAPATTATAAKSGAKAPAVKGTANPAAKQKPTTAALTNKDEDSSLMSSLSVLKSKPVDFDTVNDWEALMTMKRLFHVIWIEGVTIAIICALLVTATPFFKTRFIYYWTPPDHTSTRLVPLTMPNLTNSAIKAWAASSVTEILTIGFGDFNQKLLLQKERFTALGWGDFVHAFIDKKVGESFKKSQLVLTTAPSEDPTIVSQGENDDHIYQWVVKVPVIMTYATNNEKTVPEKSTVTLTLVRVPYDDATRGVAIDSWRQ